MNVRKARSVAVLNYHEVTRDARVFKQARALAEAGYRVCVYCHHPDGLPPEEVIDGVTIKRFRCFDRNGLNEKVLARLDFLQASRVELVARYRHFLAIETAAQKFAQGAAALPRPPELDRRYYKHFSGFSRFLRKLEYRYFRMRLRRIDGQESRRIISRAFVPLSSYLREQRTAAWQALEAVRSVLFLENLLKSFRLEPADVVHAHDLLTLPAGAVMAREFGARLIYDAHEYEPERVSLSPDERAFTKKLESDCLTSVDAIVTVSKGIAQLYAQRFRGEQPLLIYNSPDLKRSQAGQGTKRLRERLNLSPDVPLVVFIGGIQRENRGVDQIVGALVHLPGYHLVNLGPRNKPNDQWLLEIAQDLAVADRLHFLEPVPAEDVPYTVSDASLAASASQNLCLSYLHSMPNKLFEATFAGLPVCVPDRPDQKEFVGLLGHGLAMDQTDPKAIALAMKTVVEDPEKFRLTDEAKSLLEREYSWDAQVKRLLTLYGRLTDGPKETPQLSILQSSLTMDQHPRAASCG